MRSARRCRAVLSLLKRPYREVGAGEARPGSGLL